LSVGNNITFNDGTAIAKFGFHDCRHFFIYISVMSGIDFTTISQATSAIWKIILREWRTTFAPILISFSRNVVNVQCRTACVSQDSEPPELPAEVKARLGV